MKQLLITIAALVLVGCGPSEDIHEAVKLGDIEVLQKYMDTGGDVNIKNRESGLTPLHTAALYGHYTIAHLLIIKGADINAKNNEEYSATPLKYAILKGHIKISKLLISRGADVNIKMDEHETTPLYWETRRGNEEMVEFLINKGADVNLTDVDGVTPLHRAAYRGDKKSCELLISKGAKVNALGLALRSQWADADNEEFSSTFQYWEAVKQPSSVLDWALLNNKSEIVVLLSKYGAKPTAWYSIHAAIRTGNFEAVNEHINNGVSINKKDVNELTPLHSAAWQGDKEIIELLIANGADVNAKDDADWTPLKQAAIEGRTEIVELLIANGAALNAKDDRGETPLDWAVQVKEPEIAALFRKHGAKTGEELKAEGK